MGVDIIDDRGLEKEGGLLLFVDHCNNVGHNLGSPVLIRMYVNRSPN